MVDIDKITSYGGDYYYQGYYDYYGYTEKGAPNKTGGKLRLTKEELHDIRSDNDEMELDLDYMSSSTFKDDGRRNKVDSLALSEYDQTSRFDFTGLDPSVKSGQVRKPNRALSAENQSGKRIRKDLDIL